MQEIIYLKKYIIDINCTRLQFFFRKLIYTYKHIFNVITKRNINGFNVWILPINETYNIKKINKLFRKLKNENNIYILEKNLKTKEIYLTMNNCNINKYNNENIKKLLLLKTINYIIKIRNIKLSEVEATILVNYDTEINNYIIKKLATELKCIKIVSSKIYKFKNIEKELFDKYGIAVQFSNSNRKSLSKSKIIVNLDFDNISINEYNINNKSIIINCTDNDINIKSKIFSGVVINSYRIKINNSLENKLNKINARGEYNLLELYGAQLINMENILEKEKKVESDSVNIINLIGNNGVLSKKEFKENA